MSLEITRKGYWRLHVNGAFFSQHVTPDEGYEKASRVLDTDPAAAVQLLPPVIEVVAGAGSVPMPTPDQEPVLSDKGEDLIDFLARVGGYGQPGAGATVVQSTGDLHKDIDALTASSKTKLLATRLYADVDGDGRVEWIGIAWRGWALEWWQRVRGAINIGVDVGPDVGNVP